MLNRFKHLFVLFLLIPLSVSGAGLGRIKVKSSLGEPLSAEIEVLESSSEEAAPLNAHMANADDYAATGLPDAYILPGVRVQVLRHADNSRVLQVTTDRPVNEPFLELLIKAETPTTNVLRQYTLLLDPPASRFSDEEKPEAKPSKTAPRNTTIQNLEQADEPIPEFVPRKSRKSSRHKVKKSEDVGAAYTPNKVTPAAEAEPSADSYTTQSGDVFGKVAQRYQPEGVSLKKVMAAFYAANPEAFVDGDMNQLKAGQTLRIPTQEAMSGKKTADKAPANPSPIKRKEQELTQAKPEAAPKFVLKISPGDTDTDAQAKADHPDAPVNNNASAQGAANGAATSSASAPAAPAAAAPESAPPVDASVAPAVDAPPAPPPAESEEIKPEVKKPLLVESNADNQSFLDGLWANLKWITVGMAIPTLIFLGFYLLNRRRLAAIQRLQDSIYDDEQLGLQQQVPLAREPLYTPVQDNETVPFEVNEKQEYEETPVISSVGVSAPAVSTYHQPEDEMDIHEVDPLVEAEIYMSYGRDEQAEAILVSALKKNPQKHEISLGLLKIYAERGDKSAFEKIAHKIYESAELGGIDDAVIWGKAAIMGALLDPENPLYQIEEVEESPYLAEPEPEPQQVLAEESDDSSLFDPFESLAPLEELEPISSDDANEPKASNTIEPEFDIPEYQPAEPASQQQPSKPTDTSNVLEFSLEDFRLDANKAPRESQHAAEQNQNTIQFDDALGLDELLPTPNKK